MFKIYILRKIRDHTDLPATCAALNLRLNANKFDPTTLGYFKLAVACFGIQNGSSALILYLEVPRAAFHEHQLLVLFFNEGCDCVTDSIRIVTLMLAGGYMYWDSKLISRRWFVPWR